MIRIPFILALLCLLSSCDRKPTQPESPNVILIFADDLGFGDLGNYGHPNIRTPRLDGMAREGVKLTSFYAAAVCTPSRAALLTGRYPTRIGLPGNLGPDSPGGLSRDERTLAEALRTNGYRTAAFGKWHLGAVPGFMPTDRGFDEYYGILYSNDMMPPWVNTQRPLHLYRNDQPTDELPVEQTTLTRRYTDEAIRFLEADDDRPFFIYLPYAMPHLPISASEEFAGTSAGGDYGDVIEELDHNVGRILDALQAKGLAENTLVIFTSDNGPWRNLPPRMVNSAPVEAWHGGTTGSLSGAKATSLEGGSRVPALLWWPGLVPANRVVHELSTTMDLHAIILAQTGASAPERPLDGYDLWPTWTGEADNPRQDFYYFIGKRIEGVRDARWKLRVAPAADGWSSPELMTGEEPVVVTLHDLRNDPFEQFDRAGEFPEIVTRLREKMEAMAGAVGGTVWQMP